MNLVAWQTTVQNQWGAIVPSPIITVRDFEGNLATIYTSEGVVKDNPFVGNTEGFCQFWAKVGHYSIQGSFGAGVTPVWEVELSDYTNATISREEAVIRIANGEWDEVDDGVEMLFGANHYRKSSGATTISDMLNWVPVTPLVISQFASATVLSTNAQPAIRAALLYARALVQDIPQSPSRPGFAGHISVDLEGKLLKISNTVSMDQCAGVELINGALSADASTFPAPSGGVYPYVLKFGGANNSGSRYMNVRNLTIECNKVANGVDCVNLQNGMGEDINIHGQVQYGFRKYGPRNGACRFRNIRASEFWAGESGVELRANRTSIGISDEAADEIWENCEGIYCLTNIYIKGFGAHRHIGGHPFHGQVTDIPTFIITDAVSDGGGGTRCITSSTTGMTNGDTYVMPYIDGITAVNNIGGRAGVYPVSNVTSTTFDVAGYTFAGVFADSNSPKASRWADEMVNVLIDADVDTVDLDLEIDNGKVQVLQTATNSPDVRMRLYGVGQNVASARVALELVSDGKTSADFGGVAAEIHTSQNGFRFVAINGGTIDTVPRCAINEFRSKKANRSTELLAVGSGSSTKPSIYFTSVDDGDALSVGPTTGLFGHSDHTPALTVNGVEKLHFGVNVLLPKNAYAIANTMTIVELNTAAAAGVYDDLPDNSVIYAGGYPFVKQVGAAYDGLPVNFIPRTPSPFTINGFVGDGVADDTETIRQLATYCNLSKVQPDFSGVKRFAVDTDAQIVWYRAPDMAHAQIILLNGMLPPEDVIIANIKTTFIIEDPSTPVVAGNIVPTLANMKRGSMTPCNDFFFGMGYAYFQCNAISGPWIAGRDDSDPLLGYRQSFSVGRLGQVNFPLTIDCTATTSIYYRFRVNTADGRTVLKNVNCDPSQSNCLNLFQISRNEVSVENCDFRCVDGTYDEGALNRVIAVDECSGFTSDNIDGMAFVNDYGGTYLFSFGQVADIHLNDIRALNGWGFMGCNHINGFWLTNSLVNRFDVHGGGHNMFADNVTFQDIGIRYGWGGGWLVATNCVGINCPIISSRDDYGGYWFGQIVTDGTYQTGEAFSMAVVSIGGATGTPIGRSGLVVPSARSISISNAVRGVTDDNEAVEFMPLEIITSSAALGVLKPASIDINNISCAKDWRMKIQLDLRNMTNIADLGENDTTRITVTNCKPSNKPSSAIGGIYIRPNHASGPMAGLPGVYFVLNVNDCDNTAIHTRESVRGTVNVDNTRLAALATPSGRTVNVRGGTLVASPLIASGDTTAVLGGNASGTRYTAMSGVRVDSDTWDLSKVVMATGVQIPTGISPTLPSGVTAVDMFKGWLL